MNKYSLQEIINFIITKYPESNFSKAYLDLDEGFAHCFDESIIDSLEHFFCCEVLNLWGCGYPEKTSRMLKALLQIMRDYKGAGYDIIHENIYAMCNMPIARNSYSTLYEGLIQYVQSTLVMTGMLTYDVTVSTAWLTDLGEILLWVLNKKYDNYVEEEI